MEGNAYFVAKLIIAFTKSIKIAHVPRKAGTGQSKTGIAVLMARCYGLKAETGMVRKY